jgi:D-proline reductase (dithiol) PrdB
VDDTAIRAWLADIPVPTFEREVFNTPPRLSEARVAVVTTAGLMRRGETAWKHEDSAFRVFEADERDVILGHVSQTLDRTGANADLNVVYPVDRLEELAAEGFIGSAAPRHLSFMGATYDVAAVKVHTGPAAAELLRGDGVDVVVLTPVCPICTRTVSTLARIFEEQGLATVALVSNPTIARNVSPPRALHVDFPLGRPLGRPLDAEFQRRVLRDALGLLEQPEGPVFETFPEVIRDQPDVPAACPLPPRSEPGVHPAVAEARALAEPWQRFRATHDVSNVGRVLRPDDVPDAVGRLAAMADGVWWDEAGFASEEDLFWSVADVRAFYEESALAIMDDVPAARQVEAWFFRRTDTGKVLVRLAEVVRMNQERFRWHMPSSYIVPLSQFEGDAAQVSVTESPDGIRVDDPADHLA